MRTGGSFVFAACIALVVCAACTPTAAIWRKADYWQRSNIRDSVQLDSVKAQTWLNRDIAQCVTAVKDQERLAALREAMPADGSSYADPAQARLAVWDTPERDGYLRAEHMPFHDFESCMVYRGWERIDTVTPKLAAQSRAAWMDATHPERPRNSANRSVSPRGPASKPSPARTSNSDAPTGDDYSYFNF